MMTRREAIEEATILASELNRKIQGQDSTVVALALAALARTQRATMSEEIRAQADELWELLRPHVDEAMTNVGIFPGGN